MKDILIIEDDERLALALKDYLSLRGLSCEVALTGKDGQRKAEEELPSIILVDLFLPDINGLDLIPGLTTISPVVIVITGAEDLALAVEAMRKGAFDFMVKPLDLEALYLKLEKIFPEREMQGLVCKSPPMKKVLSEIKLAARGNASVLVLGETGVGKEEVARTIYKLSGRKGRFVAVNASALPENLFEAELFGYKRGAFTGAFHDKRGLLEEANGGVFFLDEITEMPPALQAKLLRVLETKEVRRIGDTKNIEVQFKLISSSNLPLERVRENLREDLFYRISTFIIEIPPLRERKEDIIPLAREFLREYGREKGIVSLSREAEELLLSYSWPGNVRELRNEIERACLVCSGRVLEPAHFTERLRAGEGFKTLREVEREYAERVLKAVGGNKSRAAKILGVSRPTLRKLLSDS